MGDRLRFTAITRQAPARSGAVAVLAIVAAAACFSTSPEHFVERVDPPARVEASARSFAESVDRLALGYATSPDVSADQARAIEGLEALYRSDYDRAEEVFGVLAEQSEDAEVADLAALALAKVHTARSSWSALAGLIETEPDLIGRAGMEEADRVFAEAFGTLPPETYDFESHPAVVPSAVNRFGLPVVTVSANGVEKDFVLDTGASISVLSESLSRELGATLVGDDAGLIHTSTSRMIEARPAVLDELRLGHLSIRHHPVAVLADEDLTVRVLGIPILSIDGIVGWPVFQRLAVEIDYGEGETVFRRSRSEPAAVPNLFWIGYPIVVVADDRGVPLYLGLDTGAAATHLNDHALVKTDAVAVDAGQGLRLGAGGGEAVRKRRVRDFALHLDGWRIAFPEIGVSPGAKGAALVSPDGILGSDVLQGARVVIDLPSGRLQVGRDARPH